MIFQLQFQQKGKVRKKCKKIGSGEEDPSSSLTPEFFSHQSYSNVDL